MSNPAPPPLPPPAPAAGGRQTSVLALVSLIAGILGWTVMPIVASVVAIVTGHLARAEIARSRTGSSPATLEGDGLAIGGLILGYSMLVVAVLSVFAILLFFGGLAAFFALASGWG